MFRSSAGIGSEIFLGLRRRHGRPSVTIIDSQIHIWAPETPERPWIPGGRLLAHWRTPPSADDVLAHMDSVGVDRAVLVPPSWEGIRNDVVLSAAGRHPGRFRAVVRGPLNDHSAAASLRAWAADPRVAGIRTLFAREARPWLRDGTADWIWPLAEELGLTVFFYAPGDYAGTAEVLQRHPDLKLVVDHLGIDIGVTDGNIDSFIDELVPLARFPHVAVKASALSTMVSAVDSYPFPTLHGPIKRVVEAFGADRVFWGSDLTRLTGPYSQVRDLFLHQLPFLDDEQLDLIMGKALAQWIEWA
jgi:L-fuconolactonase